MPRFEPFAGLRYDAARVDMTRVIAPPYDVIGPPERDRLAGRHSANAVRIELPEPDHRAGLDRYEHAAAMLRAWQEARTLLADPGPRLYAYRMTTPSGRTTNGVVGALGIDPASAASILPHEHTLPKPKSDRLELMRATRANLSPIWGLSLTPGLTATFLPAGPPTVAATDDDDVVHQLWVIDDGEAIKAVGRAVEASPLVLADGHHRFETALAYRSEAAAAGRDEPGADLVMALVVELSEEQLQVGPVHRALSELPDGLDLVDAFSSWFDVTRVGEPTERTVTALGESEALALVMPSGAWLLSPKDGTPEAAGAPLDASMVALVIAELPDHDLSFFHSWQEAAEAVASEQVQAVVLLRPVGVDQIAESARTGRRMPAKTTYFHPKPRTGMVYRSLDV
ncbi:MAG: DUF1015 family protein [Acidimicrobiales bacterium]